MINQFADEHVKVNSVYREYWLTAVIGLGCDLDDIAIIGSQGFTLGVNSSSLEVTSLVTICP